MQLFLLVAGVLLCSCSGQLLCIFSGQLLGCCNTVDHAGCWGVTMQLFLLVAGVLL